jgi:hypothetical protein
MAEMVKGLPLKKNASPSQILIMLGAMALLVGCGWGASSVVKDYFDKAHNEIIAAIDKVDARTSAVAATVDKHTTEIESLRHYYWSNADMNHWAGQLDHDNRVSVPGLIVPEVPQPTAGPH